MCQNLLRALEINQDTTESHPILPLVNLRAVGASIPRCLRMVIGKWGVGEEESCPGKKEPRRGGQKADVESKGTSDEPGESDGPAREAQGDEGAPGWEGP